MRPLHLVLDRIRWDPRFDPARFAVRWLERSGGLRDDALPAFLARKDVPHHRVRAVLLDGRAIWDRDEGVDDVEQAFARLTTGGARNAHVEINGAAFWNVRDLALEGTSVDDGGESDPSVGRDPVSRIDGVAAHVNALDVDVVGLVEVSAALRERLGDGWHAHGSVALRVPQDRAWTAQPLPLPGRDALSCSDGAVTVVVAHLTSNARGDRSARREQQVAALAAALPARGPLVVMLDANSAEPLDAPSLAPLAALGLVDLGVHAGGTYVPDGRRLDRVLARDCDAVCAGAVTVDKTVLLSDHWPIVVARSSPASWSAASMRARPAPRNNPGLALAVLPPAAVSTALDVIRAKHDPAFTRWPAHATVAFPFVDESERDRTMHELARAAVEVEPFDAVVDGTGAFEHARETITWARVLPEEKWAELFALVDDGAAERERVAHITLARGASALRVDVAPATFRVRALTLLERAEKGGPYVAVDEIPLGRASLAQAIDETELLETSDAAWRAALEKIRAVLPGTVDVAGSSKRGVRFKDSDLDLSWAPPPSLADPLALALATLGGERVESRSAPRINTEVATELGVVEVDVVLESASWDTAAPLDDHAREALVALRVWARRRALDKRNENDGRHMPASAAWLGLVEEHASLDSAEAIVRRVWHRLADDGDAGAVSGTGFRSVTPKTLAALRAEAQRAHALVHGVDDDDAPWRAALLEIAREAKRQRYA